MIKTQQAILGILAALLPLSSALAQSQSDDQVACGLLKQFAGMDAAEVRTHAGPPANPLFSDERLSDLSFGAPCTVGTGTATELVCTMPGQADLYGDAVDLAANCLANETKKAERAGNGNQDGIKTTNFWLTNGAMLKVYASGADVTFKFVY